MRRYRLSAAARRDLERIARYVEEAAGARIGAQVVERIRGACRMVAETPGEVGTLRPELLPRIRSHVAPPHVIFFRYGARDVEVIRILHERQDLTRHLAPDHDD